MTTIITVSSVGVQGPIGPEGPAGPDGPQGPAGQGVPTGGTTDQVLKKNSSTNYDTSWTSLTTSAIPEGTNLYYTDERVDDRVASLLVAGSGINLSYNDLLNTITISATGGGDVSSVFGRTGAVTAQSGDYTTSLVTEGSNLYYTQGRFNSAFAAKSTSDLTEGTNLYYTNARFNTDFSGKSTSDLTEGTNLYYTSSRFNTAFAAKSTTDLSEGSNLYFTNSRAIGALPSQTGNAGKVLGTDGSILSWTAVGDGTFADLTDITDSFPPANVKITASQFEFISILADDNSSSSITPSSLNWYTENTTANSYGELSIAAGVSSLASGLGAATSTISALIDGNGFAFNQFNGGLRYIDVIYSSSITELEYGHTSHVFNFAPAGNVIVNKINAGSLFYVTNNCGSTITFIQDTSELFNGATTYPLADGESAMFYQADLSGIFGVQTLGDTGGGGGVTSVSGTAPVVSSGGATPAISMAASTDSVDGYLTAVDHTTYSASAALTTAATDANTASAIVKRDSNKNFKSNRLFSSQTTTATSAGTLVLTVASSPFHILTGSNTHSVQLPNATTLPAQGTSNTQFWFLNNSTSSGNVAIKDAGSNTLGNVGPGGQLVIATLTNNSTSNGVWDIKIIPSALSAQQAAVTTGMKLVSYGTFADWTQGEVSSFANTNTTYVMGNADALYDMWLSTNTSATGNKSITLASPSTFPWVKKEITFVCASTGTLTLTVAGGGNTIGGLTSVLLQPGQAIKIKSNNSSAYEIQSFNSWNNGHYLSYTTTPSIAAGAGAGTSPTITLSTNSTDMSGEINLTTGTSPTTAATLLTLTFGRTFLFAPFPILTARNDNAAALSGANMIFPTTSTSNMILTSGPTALAASTLYKWSYHMGT